MKKIIGIYGIAGVYNLGCEAIIRGTYEHLKTQFPNAKWIYYTPNRAADALILNDLPIEIRETKKNLCLLKSVLIKSLIC